MDETTKTVRLWGDCELAWCQGRGIDIGCGPDPLPWATVRFDRSDGDANHITRHVKGEFDFVYSAHCLEHMDDPRKCLPEWWSLVKPGGHLILIVPDEDLYEQGVWPSRFNEDHKHSFSLAKRTSWSPVSINILPLVSALPEAVLILAEIQDSGYDRSKQHFGPIPDPFIARLVGKLAQWKFLPSDFSNRIVRRLRPAIDQTLHHGALAQIMVVVQRARGDST